MRKVVRLEKHIPLIDIKQLEDDGVDALEKIKLQMAIDMVYGMPKEFFDKLFKTTIIDPKSEEQQLEEFIDLYGKQLTNYNRARLDKFKELKNRQVILIKMKTEIETYEEENDTK